MDWSFCRLLKSKSLRYRLAILVCEGPLKEVIVIMRSGSQDIGLYARLGKGPNRIVTVVHQSSKGQAPHQCGWVTRATTGRLVLGWQCTETRSSENVSALTGTGKGLSKKKNEVIEELVRDYVRKKRAKKVQNG